MKFTKTYSLGAQKGAFRLVWLSYSLALIAITAQSAQTAFLESLKKTPFKIAFESYVENNWEIFAISADGSGSVNLTQTPQVHEHYPQASPDGKKICFSVDTGAGREAVRSLWVMDSDGKNRKKLADNAREPFWSPDGKVIGFLPQEFPRFSVTDYYTKGMSFYHLDTGKIEEHPNAAKLHHLYNPSYAPNGKWIAATVHSGMGYGHAILLIEAKGEKIINLNIPGCRPCLSSDGKQIAWGSGDHDISVAPIDLDSANPKVGKTRLKIVDAKLKIYHVDWSPDCRFLCISQGPNGEGDPTKPGTFVAAGEMVGVYAPGWNLLAVSAERTGVMDLNNPAESDFQRLMTNGNSNKEPTWFRP